MISCIIMNKYMKIVYFGTSEFALEPLKRLLASEHKIEAVITQPDSKGGRSLELMQSPVKKLAISEGQKVLEYKKPLHALSELRKIEADIYVVCAYGSFLPNEILELPKLYSLNIHPSLLPKYRGAAPINWALINGETKTGVTIFKVNSGMDAGDVAIIKELDIDLDDNVQTLSNKLSDLSSEMILEVVDELISDKITFTPQDKSKVSLARVLKKEDGLIIWNKDAREVHNLIRGTSGWPGAYFFFNNKRIKVLKSRVASVPLEIEGESQYKIGEVVLAHKKQGLVIKCKNGYIKLLTLQLEGKKALDDTDFLIGFKIESGDKLEAIKD